MINNVFFEFIIVIVSGLIVGSFLNVVIWRFDDLKSILVTRSHCPKCKEKLRWYDLIPVLSYVFLMGKCRYCKKEISLQYPLVEAGTAAIFALLFWQFGGFSSVLLYFYIAISAILIVIFTYDILKLQISDFLIWLIFGLWIVWLLIDFFVLRTSLSSLLSSLYGGLALGGFLGIIVAISREKWMGAGDVGLGFVLGAIAGWPNVLVAAFSAFVIGAIVGLILVAAKKKNLQSRLPFAPFLILGLFIALFFGAKILGWYGAGIF